MLKKLIESAITSQTVASIAARGVKKPETLSHEEIKTVCASVLRQARD